MNARWILAICVLEMLVILNFNRRITDSLDGPVTVVPDHSLHPIPKPPIAVASIIEDGSGIARRLVFAGEPSDWGRFELCRSSNVGEVCVNVRDVMFEPSR